MKNMYSTFISRKKNYLPKSEFDLQPQQKLLDPYEFGNLQPKKKTHFFGANQISRKKFGQTFFHSFLATFNLQHELWRQKITDPLTYSAIPEMAPRKRVLSSGTSLWDEDKQN